MRKDHCDLTPPRLVEILEQVPSEFAATEAACLPHSHPGNKDPSLQVE